MHGPAGGGAIRGAPCAAGTAASSCSSCACTAVREDGGGHSRGCWRSCRPQLQVLLAEAQALLGNAGQWPQRAFELVTRRCRGAPQQRVICVLHHYLRLRKRLRIDLPCKLNGQALDYCAAASRILLGQTLPKYNGRGGRAHFGTAARPPATTDHEPSRDVANPQPAAGSSLATGSRPGQQAGMHAAVTQAPRATLLRSGPARQRAAGVWGTRCRRGRGGRLRRLPRRTRHG
jgi:hypothetical protein